MQIIQSYSLCKRETNNKKNLGLTGLAFVVGLFCVRLRTGGTLFVMSTELARLGPGSSQGQGTGQSWLTD